MDLLSRISELKSEALKDISESENLNSLLDVENRYLSKKGLLSGILKGLKDVEPQQRPKVGELANQCKRELESAIELKRQHYSTQELHQKLEKDRIDISLPSRGLPVGTLHPVSQVITEIVSIFSRLGFNLEQGPEAELEFFNFDALNMGADHPARDMQDTFYLPRVGSAGSEQSPVLRTHTSPVQIRTMLSRKPPIRILSAGAVFRSDYDLTHSPMFHQVEGLYVNEKVSFAELKGCLLYFAREMFGAKTQIRLRPSYFPFVEPGAEVDVSCFNCAAKGCRVCKNSGWLEILGAGMVHPNVFQKSGYEANKWTGFAFGMGVERIAMLKYDIPDLRMIFENDVRFLRQFGI